MTASETSWNKSPLLKQEQKIKKISKARKGTLVILVAAATGMRLNHKHYRVYDVLFGAKSTKNVGSSDSPHTPANGSCGEPTRL